MDSSSANKSITQKTNPVPLKCPRCGSSNTKFCYYNNYSLSQPRHFCRACKRYWTRGGTLRNVPVGGGCRKNKIKGNRPLPDDGTGGISSSALPTSSENPSLQRQLDLPPTSSYVNNSLFYSLPTNPIELTFPISRLNNSARVCSDHTEFDQMNGSGLGFLPSSRLMATENYPNGDMNLNGFDQIQELVATSSRPTFSTSGENTLVFGSTSSASSRTSTMASLLASSIERHDISTSELKDIQPGKSVTLTAGLMPDQMPPAIVKDLNTDAVWNLNVNPLEQILTSSVPWSTTNFGAWIDPSTVTSSSVRH